MSIRTLSFYCISFYISDDEYYSCDENRDSRLGNGEENDSDGKIVFNLLYFLAI